MEATADDLDAHFRQLSEPISVEVVKTGVGCVAYETPDEAEMAISAFNGTELGNATIQTDAWTTKTKGSPKGGGGFPAKGGAAKGGGAIAKGNGKSAGGCWGAGAGGPPQMGWGKGPMSMMPMMMGGGKGMGAMMGMGMGFGGWGGGKGAWGPPPAAEWAAPAPTPATTPVYWLTLPQESSLVAQGLPLDGPALVWEKGNEVFSSAAHILGDLVGDITAEVQIVHDADWEQFPEVGQALMKQSGEEQCFAVAYAPQASTWAAGVANGWKGRESAAKLALSLALAAQDGSIMKTICKNYPEFGQLCRSQGLSGGAGGAAWGGAGIGADVPKLHMINVEATNKFVAAGLSSEVPCVEHSKQQKEFFSNSHSILGELIEDASTEVVFEDDPEWKIMPEIGEAIKAAGAEDNCFCVAKSDSHGVWAVGQGSGWKGRESAARLALSITLATATGRLDELAQKYPEFGQILATGGLVQPAKKSRKW